MTFWMTFWMTLDDVLDDVHYGNEIEDYIIEFATKCFIAASDFLKKERYR